MAYFVNLKVERIWLSISSSDCWSMTNKYPAALFYLKNRIVATISSKSGLATGWPV